MNSTTCLISPLYLSLLHYGSAAMRQLKLFQHVPETEANVESFGRKVIPLIQQAQDNPNAGLLIPCRN